MVLGRFGTTYPFLLKGSRPFKKVANDRRHYDSPILSKCEILKMLSFVVLHTKFWKYFSSVWYDTLFNSFTLRSHLTL